MNFDKQTRQPFYSETSLQRSDRVRDLQWPITAEGNVKLAIIGTGMIGREHMRVATLLGRACVHGIYDSYAPSMDAAEADFKGYTSGTLIRYADLSSACNDPDIDAIFICTPNYTHFEILSVAKESGKPLFIEKPMATTLQEAAQMVELAHTYPDLIQIGMQYRYKSQYVDAFHEVKQLQSLGEIKMISMCEYRPPFKDKIEQWNKFNEYSGGTLVEKCCHYFDLINLMADSEPESVYASGGQAVNFLDFSYEGRQSDIDDHAYVIINYKNGLRANFTLNMFSQELVEEMVVTGEKGRLVATENSSFKPGKNSKATITVEVEGHQNYTTQEITYPEIIERSGHHGATYFEHEAFVDQLEGRTADSATPLQGLWAMIVASAAQESIANNSIVNIDEFISMNNLSAIVSN